MIRFLATALGSAIVMALWLAVREERVRQREDAEDEAALAEDHERYKDVDLSQFPTLDEVTRRIVPTVTLPNTSGTTNVPWYWAQCGHYHAWGIGCSVASA